MRSRNIRIVLVVCCATALAFSLLVWAKQAAPSGGSQGVAASSARNPKTMLLPNNPDYNKPVDPQTLADRKYALDKPIWQGHLDWCKGDSGQVDCPSAYLATYPECIYKGGRSCLMSKAIDSAKANNCSWAFQLSLICQCHNTEAATQIAVAGQDAVCGYLKTPER